MMNARPTLREALAAFERERDRRVAELEEREGRASYQSPPPVYDHDRGLAWPGADRVPVI